MKRLLIALALILGPMAAHARDCLDGEWARFVDPGPQTATQVEAIETEAGRIGVFDMGPLAGDFAKATVFVLFKGDCIARIVSLGSYGYMAALAKEGQPRPFHLDLYAPGMHSTLGMYAGRPDPAAVRDIALKVLQGDR